MRTWLRCLTIGALLLGATAQVAAQTRVPAPEGGQPKDFRLSEPRELMLPNGMKVVLVQYGTLPKASVALVVR